MSPPEPAIPSTTPSTAVPRGALKSPTVENKRPSGEKSPHVNMPRAERMSPTRPNGLTGGAAAFSLLSGTISAVAMVCVFGQRNVRGIDLDNTPDQGASASGNCKGMVPNHVLPGLWDWESHEESSTIRRITAVTKAAIRPHISGGRATKKNGSASGNNWPNIHENAI